MSKNNWYPMIFLNNKYYNRECIFLVIKIILSVAERKWLLAIRHIITIFLPLMSLKRNWPTLKSHFILAAFKNNFYNEINIDDFKLIIKYSQSMSLLAVVRVSPHHLLEMAYPYKCEIRHLLLFLSKKFWHVYRC